jgi:hypothetical protein
MSNKTIEKVISLDLDIYSRQAIKLAKNIFAKKIKTRFAWNKGYVKIFITLPPACPKMGILPEAGGGVTPIDMNSGQSLEKEFLNEILNQQCRLNIKKRNKKIAKIIYTRALLSGLGK